MSIKRQEISYSIIGGIILLILLLIYFLFKIFEDSNIEKFNNVFVGIISGYIIAYFLFLEKLFQKYLQNRKLRKLFGFNENFSLIVPEFKVRDEVVNTIAKKISNDEFPLNHLRNNTNVSSRGLFGYVDVKAANYITALVYNRLVGKTELVSDNKCNFNPSQNFSYVAFGCTNIYFKTIIEKETKNISLPNLTILTKDPDKFGYGLIIKREDNNILKIGVGGNTEIGTSGAAFFLANNWEKIVKEFGQCSFAILIEVNDEDDISAERIDSVNLDKDNERRINSFFTSNNILKIIGKHDPKSSCSDICDNNSRMIHSKLGSLCNFINCKINICKSNFNCSINDDDSGPLENPNIPSNNDGSGPKCTPDPPYNNYCSGSSGTAGSQN